ncbi:class I SAM-dependent methyltransferase [Sphingomonas sp. PAMC 26605]|uniref:class I SAM-dependent methyltransferase n=1 Tax=Sphingomonas sp. PAMC 26605 TaxID=1112214 RepID=UPI00026CD825|nr:class I SAM-dependent methyltransferase [Sphingomonas sp. PAMC 26605]
MTENTIRFDDGANYERVMGIWSRLVGADFVDWLAPAAGLRWIDIGCGNGAFTELLSQRCAPREILGVDPSEGQLNFARARSGDGVAKFAQGDAMALPSVNGYFDAAVMALVLFFVPEPMRGVAEMKRVVRPGGLVSAYVWDVFEPEGFPMAVMYAELRDMGFTPDLPPSAAVSRIDALMSLWTDAGLSHVESRLITVRRTFPNFSKFWESMVAALEMGNETRGVSQRSRCLLRERLALRFPEDESGLVSYTSRANAVKGRVPL